MFENAITNPGDPNRYASLGTLNTGKSRINGLELGLAGAIAVALLVATWASRMASLLARASARSFTLLQIAAGVGMLPLALHSAFDFALRMPGNALWFAVLFGVLLHPGVPEVAREGSAGARRTAEGPGGAP